MTDTAQCAKCAFKIDLPHVDMLEIFYKDHNCELTALQEAIARVRKLHTKATSMFHLRDVEICGWCSSICPHEVESDVYWPCDTIRALDNIGIWFKDGEQ